MPVDLAVGDFLEVKVGCFSGNQAGINVIHWVVATTGGTSLTDLAVAVKFDQLYAPLYKALLSGVASYYGVQVKRYAPGTPSAPQQSTSNTGVGTAGTSALPRQVSGILTLLTDYAGRRNRGRQYIPFPDEADNDDIAAKPELTYGVRLLALGQEMSQAQTFTTAGDSVTVVPQLYHRALDTYTEITGVLERDKWATQRRRGNYGQANNYPPF